MVVKKALAQAHAVFDRQEQELDQKRSEIKSARAKLPTKFELCKKCKKPITPGRETTELDKGPLHWYCSFEGYGMHPEDIMNFPPALFPDEG